jgi:hypothetical protein
MVGYFRRLITEPAGVMSKTMITTVNM